MLIMCSPDLRDSHLIAELLMSACAYLLSMPLLNAAQVQRNGMMNHMKALLEMYID